MSTRLWLASLTCGIAACLDPGEPGNLVPKTVAEDPSLPRIEIAGALLHAEAFGDADAPIVMVLHGGPGADYRALLPLEALADEGYRVVFWDQRGAGLSERFDQDHYTYDVYLEDLRLVIEEFTEADDQPLVFVGHSWGAMYATWFINELGDYGGRVKGAVLSDPGGFTKEQLDAFMETLMDSLSLTGEQLNDATWERQLMSPADHARADYLMSTFGSIPSEARDPHNPSPAWRFGAVVNTALGELAADEGFDWTTDLSDFPHKVLFLRSSLDTAHTLQGQREMAASYADAEIVTMPDVGHEMIWEQPDEYLAHLRTYFAEISFDGASP